MCAFKKPSTPSYGVKLFVSLVLLAISLCLVNCTSTATAVPADEVELSIPKTDAAKKLTELVGPKGKSQKFSLHNPGYTAKDAFPGITAGATVATPTAVQPKYFDAVAAGTGGTPAATPAKFEVLLPVDITIDKYIEKIVEPLTSTLSDKSSGAIDTLLKAELAKDAHKLVPGKPVTFEVKKNFVQLETILCVNFEFDTSTPKLLKPKAPSGAAPANAGEHLFNAVFSGATPAFDPVVYFEGSTHSDAANLVENCVTAANGTASSFTTEDAALKALLDKVLGEFKTTGATEVKWSVIVTEIGKFCLETTNKIGKTVGSHGTFDSTKILAAHVTPSPSHYDKFYLKFEGLQKIGSKPDDELFIKYLASNIDSNVKDNAAIGYPALVANTFEGSFAGKKKIYDPAVVPTSPDDFHHVVTADISKLIDAIDAKLGNYSLLTFVDADIAPTSSPFILKSTNLVCEKFPVKHVIPTAIATIDNFGDYVKSIKFTPAATTDDATIKADFLKELWAKTNLDAYKATLTTPAAAPATTGTPDATTITPVAPGATGGADAGGIVKKDDDKTDENNDKEEEDVDKDSTKSSETQEAQNKSNTSGSTQSENDYMWIVWAVVGVVAAAIVAAAGYFLWKRKKNASNL